ncbi:MAG: AAA family ATPase [Spirochaetia bacterium]|nr:AAA family ATPase [Spirochaetia bacterium]
MASENKQQNFFNVKKELDFLLKEIPGADSLVHYRFGKNEFILELKLLEISNKTMIDIIILAKKHIENWRIHTFDNGYFSIQALNENVFNTDHILNNLRVRVSGIYGDKQIEISKKGMPDQSELSFIAALLKTYTGKKEDEDPLLRLEQAGCRIYGQDDKKISFQNFAGYDKIKEEVKETIILPLKHPEIYDLITEGTRDRFETNRPKAILFSGPPGVGKTTMARIIAHEAKLPLVYVPLENLMSAYYGESSKRLAMIFDIAAESNIDGLIFFLDEIDSLAPSRNEKLFEATRRMLSVLLRKIEGIESKTHYLTIGATNRKEDLDQALLSRFDTILEFPMPNKNDILFMLDLFAKHLSKDEKIKLSEKLEGFSPRAIKDICKKAERMHARELIEANNKNKSLPVLEKYINAFSSKEKI